jgi:hypothetical protein
VRSDDRDAAARSAGRRSVSGEREKLSGHGAAAVGAARSVGRQLSARRGVRGGSCRDVRRGVPTTALNRAVGVARGGHVAAARCRAVSARGAAADKWGPLSMIFELKIYPEGN